MKRVILDTCVWVNGLLNANLYDFKIIKTVVNKELEVVLSSYGVAEIFSVFRRMAQELRISVIVLERDIWAIWNQSNVIKDFGMDIPRSLLNEIRNQKEIVLLAKILELEPKDIPFVVLAFNHKISLITTDKRSLWEKRKKVEELTKVRIFLSKEYSI